MTFSSTLDGRILTGNMWETFGTFTCESGDTTGEIDTGLSRVESASAQHTGATVVANEPVFDETFPVAGGVLTLVCDDNADGIWRAWGYR